jgi:hypothetical protein
MLAKLSCVFFLANFYDAVTNLLTLTNGGGGMAQNNVGLYNVWM